MRADLPILARLLDEADVPVSMDRMARALGEAGPTTGPDTDRSPDQRARNAVSYLQEQGFTRCVNMRSPDTGYVWNDRGLSDDDWKARIAQPLMTQTTGHAPQCTRGRCGGRWPPRTDEGTDD